jgi:hypothetical protein
VWASAILLIVWLRMGSARRHRRHAGGRGTDSSRRPARAGP